MIPQTDHPPTADTEKKLPKKTPTAGYVVVLSTMVVGAIVWYVSDRSKKSNPDFSHLPVYTNTMNEKDCIPYNEEMISAADYANILAKQYKDTKGMRAIEDVSNTIAHILNLAEIQTGKDLLEYTSQSNTNSEHRNTKITSRVFIGHKLFTGPIELIEWEDDFVLYVDGRKIQIDQWSHRVQANGIIIG